MSDGLYQDYCTPKTITDSWRFSVITPNLPLPPPLFSHGQVSLALAFKSVVAQSAIQPGHLLAQAGRQLTQLDRGRSLPHHFHQHQNHYYVAHHTATPSTSWLASLPSAPRPSTLIPLPWSATRCLIEASCMIGGLKRGHTHTHLIIITTFRKSFTSSKIH